MVGSATDRSVAFTLALGLVGGSALILVEWASTRGPLVLVPYAALVLTALAYLRVEHVPGWSRRFSMTLGSFMLATLLLYLFIGLVLAGSLIRTSLAGHAWRLGLMLVIGSVLAAAVAQVSATKQRV
ncbi:MAG: hypothetical protein WA208_19730 [Thermoanaerobaculia bacterium]